MGDLIRCRSRESHGPGTNGTEVEVRLSQKKPWQSHSCRRYGRVGGVETEVHGCHHHNVWYLLAALMLMHRLWNLRMNSTIPYATSTSIVWDTQRRVSLWSRWRWEYCSLRLNS
ncbi:hypothetical protein BJV78DRAFT_1252299 [Lactifluus subvellereus]|nr:hypothetical protein BJV78DRAFT_1252299 [Lactifluus subvellereus]